MEERTAADPHKKVFHATPDHALLTVYWHNGARGAHAQEHVEGDKLPELEML